MNDATKTNIGWEEAVNLGNIKWIDTYIDFLREPRVIELGQPARPTRGQQLCQPSRVGQMSSDVFPFNLDGDPKAIVAPHKAACDQWWEFHTGDYTSSARDGKRQTSKRSAPPSHKITYGKRHWPF